MGVEVLVRNALGDMDKLSLTMKLDDDVLAIAAIAMAKVGFFKISDFSLIFMFFERLLHVNEFEWINILDDYDC